MKRIGLFAIAAVATVTALSSASITHAQHMVPELTLESAQKIATTCLAHAKENGWQVTVTVMDHHGNIKLVQRMDGARQATLEISEMKARTPATLARSSEGLGEVTQSVPGIAFVPGLASWRGGVPIYTKDGTHLGGVGVSGASSAQDAECGTLGVQSVEGLQITRP